MSNESNSHTLPVESIVNGILKTIKKDREVEIISRRFGLFDRKETLEQIGEMLGITRERVRQLEKAVLNNLLDSAAKGKLPGLDKFEDASIEELKKSGNVARVSSLANNLLDEVSKIDQSRVAFLSILSPKLDVVSEDDNYYQAVSIKEVISESDVKKQATIIVKTIKELKEPKNIKEISDKANVKPQEQAEAIAAVSKSLSTLNGLWGLNKWPTVNPKNIRDKIYVILKENGSHMHFNEISEAIKASEFKRKNVTTQAIHNELIKDKRFVLIGRGIYALKEWGYQKGTVADIITEVLREATEPLHRDEIVKRVLKSRFVKETTILLNLQGKSQFKRVAKATYTLAEAE